MVGDQLLPGRYRNAVLFVILAALWGGTYPAVTLGLGSFPPILYAAFRLDIGAALLLPYAAWRTDYWRPRTRGDWAAVSVAGLLTLAGYGVLQNVGQQTVPSAVASVLAGLIPILTVGFAKLFLPDERFGPVELLGVVVGFLGLVVITDPDPSNLLGANAAGQVILVLAAASFALGGVLAQRIETEMPFAAQTAWAMVVGAAATHLASAASPTESLAGVDVSVAGVVGLVYLGVFASAVSYLLYFSLLPRLGSVELNLVTYAIAGFGTVYSWLLFTEPVTAATLVGFGFILLGFGLLKWKRLGAAYRGRRRGVESD
ncbi:MULTISPECIES: DMT family transporter [Haloferax]|uniref:Multidrug DMT transporter permease n=2 Tax=Haloferax gibbonsii TaxID=35746 RepID=A0A0K1IVP7_HALGI|nr:MULTISPECIES: DMT family transporter [Haloferax]AKU08541.1 multidrug DMT transporter permease [Haloferax gibbonsii]ELZ80594.1 DMT(drug/metabolite transporter) superfamily permease [Haloferax gibbonsii ATCC 33959]RDZ52322.1 EamA/RhaT family transporter [Haloferax sp. Atlit-4N]REA03440.1 EamA/RhaT family transporter [Haloferax sp. Atlit-6N]